MTEEAKKLLEQIRGHMEADENGLALVYRNNRDIVSWPGSTIRSQLVLDEHTDRVIGMYDDWAEDDQILEDIRVMSLETGIGAIRLFGAKSRF